MTPFREAAALADPAIRNYNYLHSKTRIVIEQAFGIAKRRWPIMNSIRFTPDKACHTIACCAILHNICITMNDVMLDDIIIEEEQVIAAPEQDQRNARMIRNEIVRHLNR